MADRALTPPVCGYPTHRWSDWHLQLDTEGTRSDRLVCGICHPPADGVPAISPYFDDPVEPEFRSSRFAARQISLVPGLERTPPGHYEPGRSA